MLHIPWFPASNTSHNVTQINVAYPWVPCQQYFTHCDTFECCISLVSLPAIFHTLWKVNVAYPLVPYQQNLTNCDIGDSCKSLVPYQQYFTQCDIGEGCIYPLVPCQQYFIHCDTSLVPVQQYFTMRYRWRLQIPVFPPSNTSYIVTQVNVTQTCITCQQNFTHCITGECYISLCSLLAICHSDRWTLHIIWFPANNTSHSVTQVKVTDPCAPS